MSHLESILQDEMLTVLDVGARGALAPRFLPVRRSVAVYGFEPDVDETARMNEALQAQPWKQAVVLPYAVGRTERQRPFNIANSPDLSSFLQPNIDLLQRNSWKTARTVPLDSVSLDELVERDELPPTVDFMKIDTQGTELEVIQSGEKHLLDKVLGFECEASFWEIYKGQPRFSELELYLRDKSFETFLVKPRTIRSIYGETRVATSFCDVVFLRPIGWLERFRSNSTLLNSLTRKLVTLYCLYGLAQEAVRIAETFDPALKSSVVQYFTDLPSVSILERGRWFVQMFKTLLSPTLDNRLRLAHLVTMRRTEDGVSWEVSKP